MTTIHDDKCSATLEREQYKPSEVEIEAGVMVLNKEFGYNLDECKAAGDTFKSDTHSPTIKCINNQDFEVHSRYRDGYSPHTKSSR
jgi:hypothetical protein